LRRHSQGGVWALLGLGVSGAWALSLAAHGVFTLAAYHNYPGGVALARLHGRGFHSSTSQPNVSAFDGIGFACRAFEGVFTGFRGS